MGVGTGSSILSEKVFKGKITAQKDTIKATLATEVPNTISESTAESERRVKAVYNDIINSAKEREETWMEAQYAAIENSVKPQDPAQAKLLCEKADIISRFAQQLAVSDT